MTDYYRPDLALVHHRGYGFHADLCAPGIVELLEPVREAGGLVLELGCGSGLLTRYLVETGHRVVATDASPAMLEIAAEYVPGIESSRRLVLPDDPLPPADAIVAIGHPMNYLPDAPAVFRALTAVADALRAGGVLAVDLCDLEWGRQRTGAVPQGRVGDDWAIITEFSTPASDRFDRRITTFVRRVDGSWRRDDEYHRNVLIDTAAVPAALAERGVQAEVQTGFGDEVLPAGLKAVVGRKVA